MLHLLGEEPIAAEAEGQSYLTPGVVDVTLSRLRFRSGVTGHVFVSWLHPSKEQSWWSSAREQMAVFDDTAAEETAALSAPRRLGQPHAEGRQGRGRRRRIGEGRTAARRVPAFPRLRGQPPGAAQRRPRGAPRLEGARRLPAVARRPPRAPCRLARRVQLPACPADATAGVPHAATRSGARTNPPRTTSPMKSPTSTNPASSARAPRSGISPIS